jgi:hypothetical protein
MKKSDRCEKKSRNLKEWADGWEILASILEKEMKC